MGRRPPDLFEGREAPAVGQIQVEEDRRDPAPAQPIETFGEPRHAFDREGVVLCASERFAHGTGIRRILSDQQNMHRFDTQRDA